jgi:Response regulator containing CheY-like receiver, AAA-type ATPase, and DNA-binding domains
MNGRRTPHVVPLDHVPSAATGSYRPSILVVDDESAIADTLAEILCRSGYAARAAYDGEEALEAALIIPPELLITDVILPGISGVELAVSIKRIFPDCKILLSSGQVAALDLIAMAREHGHNFTLLSKPVHPRDMLANVANSLGDAKEAQLKSIANL